MRVALLARKFPVTIPDTRLGTASPSILLTGRCLHRLQGETVLSRSLGDMTENFWDRTLVVHRDDAGWSGLYVVSGCGAWTYMCANGKRGLKGSTKGSARTLTLQLELST